jgi:hypothetical protein
MERRKLTLHYWVECVLWKKFGQEMIHRSADGISSQSTATSAGSLLEIPGAYAHLHVLGRQICHDGHQSRLWLLRRHGLSFNLSD